MFFIRRSLLTRLIGSCPARRSFFHSSPLLRSIPSSHPESWINDYDNLEHWTENLSYYESGKYFAVHLGDLFGEGRYRVLHKLGNGASSQIWLAKDQWPGGHGYVSIKIVPSDASEVRVLKYLMQCPQNYPGSKNVVKLLDHFTIHASSKVYMGLVLEVMGQNAFSVMKMSSHGKLSFDNGCVASRQVAMGLEYLHRCGIGHGDLHTGNVCFTTPGLNRMSEAQVINKLGDPETQCIKRRDGMPLSSLLPQYTVKPQPFLETGWELKIVDMGQAFFFDQKPEKIIAPGILRAPELLKAFSSLDWDHRIDLWALGCLIYELFVGKSPFENPYPHSLAWELTGMIGELPKQLRSRFNFGGFVNSDGTPDFVYRPLEENIVDDYDWLGGEMTHEQLRGLASLLREVLVMKPIERKSAGEVAEHHWLLQSSRKEDAHTGAPIGRGWRDPADMKELKGDLRP